MSEPNAIELAIEIAAPREAVWDSLTRPEAIAAWLGEPEMELAVETDWSVGGPIVIRGFHHVRFEDRGRVVRFAPCERLTYTHLSSISRLPDVPESYTTLDFRLDAVGGDTALRLTLSGFPTEPIEKHLRFYWRGTLPILKRFVEDRETH
ncbi:MAG: SRPBCC domain-containing protein [Sandaracinaceae bacterium]